MIFAGAVPTARFRGCPARDERSHQAGQWGQHLARNERHDPNEKGEIPWRHERPGGAERTKIRKKECVCMSCTIYGVHVCRSKINIFCVALFLLGVHLSSCTPKWCIFPQKTEPYIQISMCLLGSAHSPTNHKIMPSFPYLNNVANVTFDVACVTFDVASVTFDVASVTFDVASVTFDVASVTCYAVCARRPPAQRPVPVWTRLLPLEERAPGLMLQARLTLCLLYNTQGFCFAFGFCGVSGVRDHIPSRRSYPE